jgi:hypothetical protein
MISRKSPWHERCSRCRRRADEARSLPPATKEQDKKMKTALKLGLVMSMAMATVVGCAAPNAADDYLGQEAAPSVDESAASVATQGTSINLNCGQSIPGLPLMPCAPDLLFGQTYAEVWAPNNAQNMAPGYYLHFGFTNDSEKATGPFSVQIKDKNGFVLKTVQFPGLAAHAGASVTDVAPYACGWSRVVTLDTGSAVAEFSESNNTFTYSHACPRMVAVGL